MAANLINAPAFTSKEEREQEFAPDTYSFSLALEPRLTQQEYVEKKKANDAISAKIQKHRDLMRQKGIAYKLDDYIGITDEERLLVIEYEKLKSSLNQLPDGVYGECGVYIREWWDLTIEPDTVGSECYAVTQSVRKMLNAY